MAGLTNDFEQDMLDHLFGKATFTAPTIYVGLSTTTPAEDGSNVTEPTGSNYGRQTTAASDWNAASTAANVTTIDNANQIDFATANADYSSGANITHVVLFNHTSNTNNANVIAFGALTTAKPILNGDTPIITAGSLDITLD